MAGSQSVGATGARRKNAARPLLGSPYECETCGAAGRARDPGTVQRFCSRTCAAIAREARKAEVERLGPIHMGLIREWSVPDPQSGCWVWSRSRDVGGYGMIRARRRGVIQARAHRVSYELAKGPIPEGMVVCHRCDNPACVNPDHLFAGTQKENMRDCADKGRIRVPDPALLRGEGAPLAKLTWEQVRQIRADGRTQAEIGRAFGVTQTTIGRIKRGETWRGEPGSPTP